MSGELCFLVEFCDNARMSGPSLSEHRLRTWLASSVVVHLIVATWHGAAHLKIPVPLNALQTLFVGVVITAMPLIGMGMLWTKYRREAAALIALSMFGSLVFGVVNHYVLESPDHVSAIPEHAWRHAFVLSAALVAPSEAIGLALGVMAFIRWHK